MMRWSNIVTYAWPCLMSPPVGCSLTPMPGAIHATFGKLASLPATADKNVCNESPFQPVPFTLWTPRKSGRGFQNPEICSFLEGSKQVVGAVLHGSFMTLPPPSPQLYFQFSL